MKKTVFILLSLLAVLACVSIAATSYKHHKVAEQVKTNTLANQLAVKKAVVADKDKTLSTVNTQITNLTNQKNALCLQVKAAKLAQPLCN